MASNDGDSRAGMAGNKTAVYVAAALIAGLILYVGVGVLSADCAGSYDPKPSAYRGAFAPLRCRYKAR